MFPALQFVPKQLLFLARIGTVPALAILFWVLALTALAQGETAPPVVLTDAQSEYSLAPHLEILRDPTRQLTIEDVTSPAFFDRFALNRRNIPNFGNTTDAVWVRFRVQNRAALATWLLGVHEARLGKVDLYLPSDDGSYRVKKTGRDLPFTAREIPNREFVFRLVLPAEKEQTIYLRLESVTPMIFPLEVWTVEALAQHDQSELFGYGLFYGAMLIMAGYNLFLFFSLREPSYLYLALFIVCYSLNQGARDGLAHQYLYPTLSNRYGVEYSGALMMIFLSLFSMSILETRTRVPRLHLLLIAAIAAFLIWLLFSLFIPLNIISNLLIESSVVLMGLVGFIVWRQGYRPARLYLLSWMLFFVVGFLFVVNSLGLVPDFSFPDEPLLIAVSLAALLGSLALADRVNLLKAETEESHRELERSERKYHSLFDNSRDGISLTTRDGQILDVNPAWLNIFGMVRSDLAHTNTRDLYLDPDERAAVLEAIDERGYIQEYPVRLRRRDGGAISALLTVTPWEDKLSGLVGYQAVVRDVTAQRRMEQELAEQQAQLHEAVAEERGRLARELHDSVTQSLYSIGLYANAAARAIQVGKKEVGADHLKQIIQLGLEAMVDMRSLIFELRPPALEKVGLAAALHERLQAVEGRAGVAVEFHTDGSDGLSLPVQTELYRIAQEALGNVVKHAHAKHVVVNLDFETDRAVLEIRDDGQGFDLKTAQQKNTMGLRSIVERAQKINGVLTVEGEPGKGTLVRVEVPYD